MLILSWLHPALVKTPQPEQGDLSLPKTRAELGRWSLGWHLTLPGLCLLSDVQVILHSSNFASGLEGLWSKACPLPGVEI